MMANEKLYGESSDQLRDPGKLQLATEVSTGVITSNGHFYSNYRFIFNVTLVSSEAIQNAEWGAVQLRVSSLPFLTWKK